MEQKILNVSNKKLPTLAFYNLTGVTKLYCQNNNLKTLPELPDTLEELICFGNKLVELPKLPPNLKTLYCNCNQLKELPELPDTLLYLKCSTNKLTHINLPPNLVTLKCMSNNKLVSLGDRLPESLHTLHMMFTKIHKLPNIPKCLFNLWCEGSGIQVEQCERYHQIMHTNHMAIQTFELVFQRYTKPKWKNYLKDFWPIEKAKYIAKYSKRKILREAAQEFLGTNVV